LLQLKSEINHSIIEYGQSSEMNAMPKYVVWGSYCEDVVRRRAPYRQAHLDRLAELKASGAVITIGPTKDLKKVFGVYEAADEAAVRKLVEEDPYWQNGIWTEYQLEEWIQAF
jgi:uncharacterized protein YciI